MKLLFLFCILVSLTVTSGWCNASEKLDSILHIPTSCEVDIAACASGLSEEDQQYFFQAAFAIQSVICKAGYITPNSLDCIFREQINNKSPRYIIVYGHALKLNSFKYLLRLTPKENYKGVPSGNYARLLKDIAECEEIIKKFGSGLPANVTPKN